jgi:hypothetical protein
MTDEATTAGSVDRITMLATKLERESRATRYLLVICTAANLAVMAFSMKVAYEWLPPIMLAHFMEHMSEVMMTQRAVGAALDRAAATQAGRNQTTPPATTTPSTGSH